MTLVHTLATRYERVACRTQLYVFAHGTYLTFLSTTSGAHWRADTSTGMALIRHPTSRTHTFNRQNVTRIDTHRVNYCGTKLVDARHRDGVHLRM
eukprot:scaffold260222_cov36-Prasinocladus_malaysianus.AAC.1